ncbi:MAG: DUF2147 domain-containing protein [Pseudomonadota bacterium]
MKTFTLAASFAAMATAVLADDPVDGLWKVGPGESGGYLHVTISECGSAICGTIDNAFDAQGNEALDYPNLGKQLIWDMIPEGNGTYDNGKIWHPEKDKTYKSKMTLDGQNKLTVKGCVAGGLICIGQTWARVQ